MPARSSPEWDRPWRVAPDLGVEIASPNQYRGAAPLSRSEEGRPELAAKARTYLDAGGRLVWIIWAKLKRVDVWHPGADQPVATFGVANALDGLDVLPWFSYALTDLLT